MKKKQKIKRSQGLQDVDEQAALLEANVYVSSRTKFHKILIQSLNQLIFQSPRAFSIANALAPLFFCP